MNDLERFVIKPALREINAFSSYHVQLERVRVGKRVERVILRASHDGVFVKCGVKPGSRITAGSDSVVR